MSRLVLDASAALEALLGRPRAAAIIEVLEAADRVSAPDLYFAEIANALWKHVRAGELSKEDAQQLVAIGESMVNISFPALDMAPEALAAASAFDHPVDDALYAVVARRDGSAVCTLDQRLTKLLEAMRVDVVEL